MKNAIKVLCFVLAIVLIGLGAFFFAFKWDKSEFLTEEGDKKGTVIISDYIGKSKDVVIPNKLRGKTVVALGEGVFENSDIKSVKINKNITSLGNNCFGGCKNLENVDLANIKSLGNASLANCTSLKTVIIPKTLESYGESVFGNDTALTEVKLESEDNFKIVDGILYSSDMTVIYDTMPYANLTSLSIPDSVKTIKNFAFYSQKKLANVTIGKSVAIIPQAAFAGCTALTDVTIPTNVKQINSLAFASSGLKTITIPLATSVIEKAAFYNIEKQLTIKTTDKSAANIYAKDNEIKCEIIK